MHRVTLSGRGRADNLCPNVSGFPVPCGHQGLVQLHGFDLAAVKQSGREKCLARQSNDRTAVGGIGVCLRLSECL